MPMWASDEGGEVQICWKVGGTDVSIFWFFFPPVSARYEGKEAIPCCQITSATGDKISVNAIVRKYF